ncbi:very short patch repair endonuclease [Vibrio rhizosphaerae]|uniref:very short patch repair endonuclease n=1 Tax=Vibrio rhizosphaerae TaxID=398736 RepID=UPI00068B707C|nr:very short patch repair endonuclease [Vibrio rhizosphaerae]
MDIHDKETRSKNMKAVKAGGTTPEILLRNVLSGRGLFYQICPQELPGKLDLYFPEYKAAVFVHGCFWHAHNCKHFRLPQTRKDFWSQKLNKNVQRDSDTTKKLCDMGTRVLIVWECSVSGSWKLPEGTLGLLVITWLKSGTPIGIIDTQGLHNFTSYEHIPDEMTWFHAKKS